MRAKEEMISWDKLEPVLAQIKEAAMNSETDRKTISYSVNLYLNLIPI